MLGQALFCCFAFWGVFDLFIILCYQELELEKMHQAILFQFQLYVSTALI